MKRLSSVCFDLHATFLKRNTVPETKLTSVQIILTVLNTSQAVARDRLLKLISNS